MVRNLNNQKIKPLDLWQSLYFLQDFKQQKTVQIFASYFEWYLKCSFVIINGILNDIRPFKMMSLITNDIQNAFLTTTGHSHSISKPTMGAVLKIK